jgi:hypothetical protein
MKRKLMYYYSQIIFHLCMGIHKLYSVLEREHHRMYLKIMEELND